MGYGDVQTPAAKERKKISAIELHQYIRYIFCSSNHFPYYVEVGGMWEQASFPLEIRLQVLKVNWFGTIE